MSNMCWHTFEHSLPGKTRLWLKEAEKNKKLCGQSDTLVVTLLPTVALRPPLVVRRISARFQYNCAKNGKGLKIGTTEADTT